MSITFENPNRRFDESINCMRFSGYDGAIEVSFFLKVEALVKLCPQLNETEAEILQAFDLRLQKIHKAASKVYGQNRKTYVCTITSEDI
jgi:predicted component of viral defense system (DUF524 family)